MSVFMTIDGRDEELTSCSSWFSRQDANCGMTIHLENAKIHLTSSQFEDIIDYWNKNKGDVKAALCQTLLGHQEIIDETSQN